MYIFTAVVLSAVQAVMGPRGAFPSWTTLLLLSCVNGCVFYGLFNATYPFSFFLQDQVYSECTAASLCAYTLLACVTQLVPALGGFNPFGAWLFCLAASIAAYTKMGDIFAYLGYPESRTEGHGLWHPWVAFLLVVLSLAMGQIQNAVSIASNARFFEPGGGQAAFM